MRFLILIAFSFLIQTANAQFAFEKYTIKLLPVKFKEDYRTGNQLNRNLNEIVKESFNISWNSSITIKPVINTGKVHLIEGMDVKSSGKAQLEFYIKDINTKEAVSYTYAKQVSGRTTKDVAKALVDAFENDVEKQAELIVVVSEFITDNFNKHCERYREQIVKFNQENKYDKALALLLNYDQSNCDNEATSILSQTLEEQAAYNCREKIQKASVMINSGVNFQINRAIPILLSIAPNAPCADEAIALSKQVGEKMTDSNKYRLELSKYQSFSDDYDSWKLYYLTKLMAEEN